jgi:hypothetical protein
VIPFRGVAKATSSKYSPLLITRSYLAGVADITLNRTATDCSL